VSALALRALTSVLADKRIGHIEVLQRYTRNIKDSDVMVRAASGRSACDDVADMGAPYPTRKSKYWRRSGFPISRYHGRVTSAGSPEFRAGSNGWQSEKFLFQSLNS
jgi:hypothetical protein